MKISIQGLKMTLACWIWTIWMSTTVAFVGHLPHFLSSKIWSPNVELCPSIRYTVPAKISPEFPLCQKNWFCGKACLNDFYPLLHSKSSSWIHISIKRMSTTLGWKAKLGAFLGPPCKFSPYSLIIS